MTTNICVECNAEVAPGSETCPECGFPFASLKPITCPGCDNLVVFSSDECPVCHFPFDKLDPALFKNKPDPDTAVTPEQESEALAVSASPMPEKLEPSSDITEAAAGADEAEKLENIASDTAPSPVEKASEPVVEEETVTQPTDETQIAPPQQAEEVVASVPEEVAAAEGSEPETAELSESVTDNTEPESQAEVTAAAEAVENEQEAPAEATEPAAETEIPVTVAEAVESVTGEPDVPVVAGQLQVEASLQLASQLEQLKETVDEIARSTTDAALGLNGVSDEFMKQKQDFTDKLNEMAQSLTNVVNTALAAHAEAQKAAINEISNAIKQIKADSDKEPAIPFNPGDKQDYILLVAVVILVFSILGTLIAAYAVRLTMEE